MLELPGQMQVTLVAHYGHKPAELAQLIADLQDMLASPLRSAFQPYQVGQVHGTLIGLEGYRVGGKVRNDELQLLVDLEKLLSFVRSEIPSIKVRVGGFGTTRNSRSAAGGCIHISGHFLFNKRSLWR